MQTRYTCAKTGLHKYLSHNQCFYLFNHLEVLGFDRGIKKCINKLDLSKRETMEIYDAIHAKKKPNQLAG